MIKHFIFTLVLTVLSLAVQAQKAFKLYLDSDSTAFYGQVQKPFQTSAGDNYFFAVHNSSSIIVKTDENGSLLWTKSLYSAWYSYLYTFTKYQDDVLAMRVTSDTISLIKFDASGNEQWSKNLIKNTNFTVKAFLVTDDLKIVLAGHSVSSGTPTSISVYTCDSVGNFLTGKEYSMSLAIGMETLDITADGGYLITGKRGDDQFLIRTNPQGNIIWNHIYKTSNTSYFKILDAIETASGEIITTGRYYSTSTYARPYMIKYDATGTFLWLKYYLLQVRTDVDLFISEYAGGNLCLFTSVPHAQTGQRRRVFLHMDPGGNPINQEELQYYSHLSNGSNSITSDNGMLHTYYQSWTFAPIFEFAKTHYGYNQCPVIDPIPVIFSNLTNIITLTDVFNETSDFLINSTSPPIPIIYGPSIGITFVCGNTGSTGIEDELSTFSQISVFPNPSSDYLSLKYYDNKEFEIELYSNTGSLVINEAISNIKPISISHLPNALYFYRLKSDGKNVLNGKFVKTN